MTALIVAGFCLTALGLLLRDTRVEVPILVIGILLILGGALGSVIAAPRPFVLNTTLSEGIHVGPDKYYRLGNAVTIVTRDPSMRAHLDSFIGREVTLHLMEGH